ncbi:kinase-like protein [Pseudovirgaria hyperparasitica]|uniref:Kinase-like protein n=1 Tax=Pseudovirgaria hyperparasitica TaxID=470096 RepID=A0A6A6WEH2_9PEZI|nr:kinase-like protein [Pseudovirgaria hyperparasitica]KAF2760935.1 kinase-like protein [Pseudovirgaria hyperparasitica]
MAFSAENKAGRQDIPSPQTAEAEYQAEKKRKEDEKMVEWLRAEDSDSDDGDMFGGYFDAEPKLPKEKKSKNLGPVKPMPLERHIETDDHEAYYKFFKHELMHNRYHIVEKLGKGSYATVVRALDTTQNQKVVAIKIIRKNGMMADKARDEIDILRKIKDWCVVHPEDQQYLVEFLDTFTHRQHICIIFENMGYNLRDVLTKSKGGHDTGLNIDAVRIFAKQLFTSLRVMKDLDLVHGDLKPDNILMNPGDRPEYIKLADFGTTFKHRLHNESEKYDMRGELGSRFYRPPEVILGIEWGYDMDIWAAGCTLFEIFTGKILFTGMDNAEMLYQIMKTTGHISRKYYRQGVFFRQYFDDDVHAVFHMRKVNEKGNLVTNSYANLGPKTPTSPESLLTKLRAAAADPNDRKEAEKIEMLADLLSKCLHFNHDKRIGPHGSLQHPFIVGKTAPAPKKPARPLFTPSAVGQKDRLLAERAREKKRAEAMQRGYARQAAAAAEEARQRQELQEQQQQQQQQELQELQELQQQQQQQQQELQQQQRQQQQQEQAAAVAAAAATEKKRKALHAHQDSDDSDLPHRKKGAFVFGFKPIDEA